MGVEVETLTWEGHGIRVVRHEGVGRVVVKDVLAVLGGGQSSRAVDSIDPSQKSKAVLSRGRPVATVSAVGLASILGARRSESNERFTSWARASLFPFALAACSLEAAEATLQEFAANSLSWPRAKLSFLPDGVDSPLLRNPGDGRLWGTLDRIALAFGTSPRNVQQHIDAIFGGGILDKNQTTKNLYERCTLSGVEVRRLVTTYDFHVINAVADRVNTPKAATFRCNRTEVFGAHVLGTQGILPGDGDRVAELEATVADLVSRNRAQDTLLASRDREIDAMRRQANQDAMVANARLAVGLRLDLHPTLAHDLKVALGDGINGRLRDADRDALRRRLADALVTQRRLDAATTFLAMRDAARREGRAFFPDRLAEAIAFERRDRDVFLFLSIHGFPLPFIGLDPAAVDLADNRLAALLMAELRAGSDVVLFLGGLAPERAAAWYELVRDYVPAKPFVLQPGRIPASVAGEGRLVVERRKPVLLDPSAPTAADKAAVEGLSDDELAAVFGWWTSPERHGNQPI